MNARSIAKYLQLAYSTVTKILRRLCLTKKTLKREKAHRYEHEHPGDMLHLDINKLQRFTPLGINLVLLQQQIQAMVLRVPMLVLMTIVDGRLWRCFLMGKRKRLRIVYTDHWSIVHLWE